MDFATSLEYFIDKKITCFCIHFYEGLVRGEMGTKISSRVNEDY